MSLNEPPLQLKAAAAAAAACLSAVVVNPFDVVKARAAPPRVALRLPPHTPVPQTRQQAAAAAAAAAWSHVPHAADRRAVRALEAAALSPHARPTLPSQPLLLLWRRVHPHLPAHGQPHSAARRERAPSFARSTSFRVAPRLTPPLQCYIYDHSLEAARRIVRHEGWPSLWRGTGATLLMAAPSVALYLPAYDHLQRRISDAGAPGVAPALAGGLSRGATVFLVAPLELVRTRLQASTSSSAGGSQQLTLGGALRGALEEGGRGGGAGRGALASTLSRLPRLWRGVVPTLARDVPFSALYWAGLEPLRRALLAGGDAMSHALPSHRAPTHHGHEHSDAAVLRANVVAGGVAGAAAAAATTPLDVAKTRAQLARSSGPRAGGGGSGGGSGGGDPGLWQLLRAARAEGGLFTGAAPRAARAAPACAIVLAAYELLKRRVAERAAGQSWAGGSGGDGAMHWCRAADAEEARRVCDIVESIG